MKLNVKYMIAAFALLGLVGCDKNFEEFEEVNWNGSTANIEGYATGTIFGHRFAGVNPVTGNATFYLTERAREVWAEKKEVSMMIF